MSIHEHKHDGRTNEEICHKCSYCRHLLRWHTGVKLWPVAQIWGITTDSTTIVQVMLYIYMFIVVNIFFKLILASGKGLPSTFKSKGTKEAHKFYLHPIKLDEFPCYEIGFSMCAICYCTCEVIYRVVLTSACFISRFTQNQIMIGHSGNDPRRPNSSQKRNRNTTHNPSFIFSPEKDDDSVTSESHEAPPPPSSLGRSFSRSSRGKWYFSNWTLA